MLVCVISHNTQIMQSPIKLYQSTLSGLDSTSTVGIFLNDYGQNPAIGLSLIQDINHFTQILTLGSIAALFISVILLLLAIRTRSSVREERRMFLKEKSSKNDTLRNLAYDLKTPLSMIYNPVKEIIESSRTDIITISKLQSVIRQADMMTHMVNIILDETDEGIEKKGVCTESVELNEWIDYLADEFIAKNNDRNIVIHSEPDLSIDTVILDKEITSEAIFAVLESVLSYCSNDCSIVLKTTERKGYLLLSVECTSIDNPFVKENLFDAKNDGSGNKRDLSSARIRMNLMGGDIIARSESGKTSLLFYIKIPAFPLSETSLISDEVISPYRIEASDSINEVNEGMQDYNPSDASILIVDDQQDFLDYMKKEFQPYFKKIYTEPDGKQALETLTVKMPDIVVSDIMMPRMNGFDLCKKIKSDSELSHIPVILLTSRTNLKIQEVGYKMGADVYLSKPFDINVLYKLICSQIKNRREIKRQYAGKLFSSMTTEITHNVADEQFVIKLNKIIKDNIDNTKLDVTFLLENLGISRTSLFLKSSHLLGVSAGRYIKQLRMEAAKELLTKTDKQINEIASCVGFSESQYFSTVFKQVTGMTPKQFKELSKLNKIQ